MTEDLLRVYRIFMRDSGRISLGEYSLETYEADLRLRFHDELESRGVGDKKLQSAVCYVPGGLILTFGTQEVDFDGLFNEKYKLGNARVAKLVDALDSESRGGRPP